MQRFNNCTNPSFTAKGVQQQKCDVIHNVPAPHCRCHLTPIPFVLCYPHSIDWSDHCRRLQVDGWMQKRACLPTLLHHTIRTMSLSNAWYFVTNLPLPFDYVPLTSQLLTTHAERINKLSINSALHTVKNSETPIPFCYSFRSVQFVFSINK